MDETTLTRSALMLRNDAALRLLRSDPELTPEEALLLVVAPGAALREASRAAAREALAEAADRGCSRCHSDVDDAGYCAMCGAVSLDAALVAG